MNPKEFRFNYRRAARCTTIRGIVSASAASRWRCLGHPARPGNGHPSPKPVELYTRMLDMTGKAGGTLLEMFSGGSRRGRRNAMGHAVNFD